MIGKDGTVLQTRPETDRTGHTRNQAINQASLAIVLAGDFNVEQPDPRQLRALSDLVGRLQAKYDIPAENVIGHTEASPTSCPGKNILLRFHR